MPQRKVTQGVAAKLTALLTLSSTGAPATGLTSSDLTCQYRKEGGSFVAKSLVGAGILTELGSGIYTVQFTAAELDTLGQFIFVITSASTSEFAGDAEVVLATQTPTSVSLLTCILTGHVYALDGVPVEGAVVMARVVGQPTLQGNIGLTNETVSVVTDDSGQFWLTLPRLAVVDVSIPSVGEQRRITVPNAPTQDYFTAP